MAAGFQRLFPGIVGALPPGSGARRKLFPGAHRGKLIRGYRPGHRVAVLMAKCARVMGLSFAQDWPSWIGGRDLATRRLKTRLPCWAASHQV
jgi:hypothetical protein